MYVSEFVQGGRECERVRKSKAKPREAETKNERRLSLLFSRRSARVGNDESVDDVGKVFAL